LRIALIERDLWRIVDGSEKKPTNPDELLKWEARDARALSLIMMSIGDSQIHHVSSATSSKEAWDSLKSIFGQANAASRLFLKKKFYRFEMEEGKSIAAHVSDIKEMMAQLAGAGV
jgi:hypothetical protein